MKRQVYRTLIIGCSLLAVCAAEPKPASAGIVGDAWWAVFGPPGTPWFGGRAYGYSAYYGGGYSRYYGGYSSYYGGYSYRPARSSSCYTPCNPCYTSCNPCATPCSPCGSGTPCAVSDSGGPRTFKNGEYQGKKPPMPKGDSDFENRENSKGFGPTREKIKDEDGKKSGTGDGGKPPAPGKKKAGFPDAGQTSDVRATLKPDDGTDQGRVIRLRKPVPPRPPLETERQIDRVKLSGKITWRPVVLRTRLIINAKLRSPSIARTTIDPNARWQPVPGGTRIVRK